MHATKNATNVRTWVRSSTPARVDEILRKARDVLVRDGYADFNLRKVAAEVGVRLATIQHHFATREALLTAAITKAMQGWGERFQEIAGRSARDPERRLRELQQQNFAFLDDPETGPLIVECFALAQHDASIRAVVQMHYFAYRSLFADVLREMRPDLSNDTLMAFATVLTAQMEGLTLMLRRDDPHQPNRAALERALKSQFDAFVASFRAYRPTGARGSTNSARAKKSAQRGAAAPSERAHRKR
ncbi:MAG TPA: TetR/AcrR family transcriptional regulator [Pseudomonadales bacterium]|nr:TetR/AcrR family transcriptional regulator [Pseudomonadales bacterium]